MLPVGTVSAMIGTEYERARYCVVPSLRDGGPLMRRYNDTGAHVENVIYRGRRAWYLELDAFRETQKQHALKRYGRPRVDKCLALCAEASRLLTVPIRKRIDPLKTRQAQDLDGRVVLDGDEKQEDPAPVEEETLDTPEARLAFQWLQRWLREELVRLRIAAAFWLVENSSLDVSRSLLAIDSVQLWEEASMTNWELTFAVRACGAVPVLCLHGDHHEITVALPSLEPDWQRAHTVHMVRNTRTAPISDDALVTLRMENAVARLWAYLPETPELSTHAVGLKSYYYPHADHLERTDKDTVMEPWVRDRISRQNNTLEKVLAPRAPKPRKKTTRIVSDAGDEDFFG